MNRIVLLCSLALFSALFGDNGTPSVSGPASGMKERPKAALPVKKEVKNSSNPVDQISINHLIMIESKARATDYVRAFEILRKEKTAAKVFIQLNDDTQISNIIDITLMPEGTLLVVRYNTAQGIRYQIVGIEEIATIDHN